MDKKQERIWLEVSLNRYQSKAKANPEATTKVFEESDGALQMELDKGVAIRPIKLASHEKQELYIDLAHIVERWIAEIGHARQQLHEGRPMKWVVEECLPKTRVLGEVIAHYVKRGEFEPLASMREEILTPTPNKAGDARGKPKTATYMLDYLASEYGVDHDTIDTWIDKGRKDARKLAQDPEKMAAVFGLDLTTLQGTSETAREALLLGKSVNLSGGKTIALTTLGPLGISDLSDQDRN